MRRTAEERMKLLMLLSRDALNIIFQASKYALRHIVAVVYITTIIYSEGGIKVLHPWKQNKRTSMFLYFYTRKSKHVLSLAF